MLWWKNDNPEPWSKCGYQGMLSLRVSKIRIFLIKEIYSKREN